MSEPEEDIKGNTPEERETAVQEDTSSSSSSSSSLFHIMAKSPWPFMVFWPVLFLFLIGFGWTQDDIIEDEVNNIWIPQRGDYASDVRYAEDVGEADLSAASFAAMAIARDGGNLFTSSRLEEIRARMEKAEGTTITYKGKTYTWADLCANSGGFPYEFPCARLTPMDLFQEANWFFNYTGPKSYQAGPIPAEKQDLYRRTWYNELIQKLLVKPRLPRFAALTGDCASSCMDLLIHRAATPLLLFADVGNLEMSDDCRICIETEYNKDILELSALIPGTFGVIAKEMQRFASSTNNTAAAAVAVGIAGKAATLWKTITSNDVQEFYFYYVAREVYASIGAPAYQEEYKLLENECQEFSAVAAVAAILTCPDTTVTKEEAEEALKRHADTAFSSVTTPGAPFPMWSEGDGTGSLFMGNSPVGGSGIDMSANMTLIVGIFDVLNFENKPVWSPNYPGGVADPTELWWTEFVEKNPFYAWFMASLEVVSNMTYCGNETLTGTSLADAGLPLSAEFDDFLAEVDKNSTMLAMAATQFWCNKFNIPNKDNAGEGNYTKQHFAKMWYDLLISSDSFLGIKEGVDDPYTWTTGQGCGYSLGGERKRFTNAPEESLYYNTSEQLYFLDEGESIGDVSPQLLVGGFSPVGNTIDVKEVSVVQTLYAALLPNDLKQRVKHCKRPDGPHSITFEDAEEILYQWKEAMENSWTEGWDDEDAGEVQFVAFFDDSGVVGTTGRMLKDITLDNNKLTAISIIFIALFSVLFLFSWNLIESRVLVTLIGVALVVLAFFAAVGFALLIGVKISVTIAWTLPFIILGLGVDDVYITLEALKKSSQEGFGEKNYLAAMKEVVVPVTMTSIVNISMFAILNISDIPAIYLTAQVAAYSVIALYCAVVFCFPAFCYLDMKRQEAGKRDVCFCLDHATDGSEAKTEDFRSIILYDKFYQPLVLGKKAVRLLSHLVIWLITAGLIGTAVYGITQREVGLGLEDFFPSNSQASVWATKRTEALASWSIGINWGALDYTNPNEQMAMIKQFEDVVNTTHVDDVDTKRLWMANFLIWTTRLCTDNFNREDFDTLECGQDTAYVSPTGDVSTCSGTWVGNDMGLRKKIFSDYNDPACYPNEGGICRPRDRMHKDDMDIIKKDPILNASDVFCPVVDSWSDVKWQHCLVKWRSSTGFSGGRFVFEEDTGSKKTDCPGSFNKDQNFTWPIPFSAGPTMFAYDLFSHQDTLDMIEETSAICDDNEDLHCWINGIPADYWRQYIGIFDVLIKLAGYSTEVGFAIAFIFLFAKLYWEKNHGTAKVFGGSLIGAILIALTIILSLVTVVGLSILSNVNLTGFSNMSFVLSVGFAVEYSVHIVSRWLRADCSLDNALDRVKHTMSFLMLPTFMSFVSSTIGVICLAFTEFEFNQVFFFRPLIIVMFVTYFYGCWWLPAALTLINFDVVKLGKVSASEQEGNGNGAEPKKKEAYA